MNQMPPVACQIRPISTPKEMSLVVELQRAVWPGSELEIVPAHLLLTAVHNGGLLAGAFAEERLIGFVFSFLGFHQSAEGRQLKHCSHMLGVHPEFRDAGIGRALKCYQREFVLRQGLKLITWTYDPLLARNAHLNIARLGAVCNTYLVDFYGELADGLNVGLPSDRFQVDWWIAEARVAKRLQSDLNARPGLDAYLAADTWLINPPETSGRPRPPGDIRVPEPPPATALLEIPADFLALKAADPSAALHWRLSTREVFVELFRHGYIVTDFIYQPGPPRRGVYVLSRTDSGHPETDR